MRDTLKEPTTLSVSLEAAETLRQLQEAGLFQDKLDAYRFALALALASGEEGARAKGERQTMFNRGTFDPDDTIYQAVLALRTSTTDEPVYETCQRLAEWGLEELRRRLVQGPVHLAGILNEVIGAEK